MGSPGFPLPPVHCWTHQFCAWSLWFICYSTLRCKAEIYSHNYQLKGCLRHPEKTEELIACGRNFFSPLQFIPRVSLCISLGEVLSLQENLWERSTLFFLDLFKSIPIASHLSLLLFFLSILITLYLHFLNKVSILWFFSPPQALLCRELRLYHQRHRNNEKKENLIKIIECIETHNPKLFIWKYTQFNTQE